MLILPYSFFSEKHFMDQNSFFGSILDFTGYFKNWVVLDKMRYFDLYGLIDLRKQLVMSFELYMPIGYGDDGLNTINF